MDVHYKPDDWQNMKTGIDQITKEALTELNQANNLLESIEAKIHSLDADRSIHFQHSSQLDEINKLLDAYTTLGNYCTRVGQVVSRHIDEPFYKDMDKFAGKMRDLSIQNYSTKNRIGSTTTTTTMPNAHGYGVAQTITTKKDKITVDDIFKDSVAFDKVLHAQYKEIKAQNPDAKLDYAEYRKLVPSMRGFEYKTIEDQQKKLETVRDFAIGAGLFVLSIACPPVGITASVLYGGMQLKSARDGEDWLTGRKLSNSERIENGIFGALDAIPVLGTAMKALKGFKGTIELGSLAKLTKLKDGVPNFNPNLGKNMVQSLHDSKNTWLRNLKIKGWEAADILNAGHYKVKDDAAQIIDGVTGAAVKVVDGVAGGINVARRALFGKSLDNSLAYAHAADDAAGGANTVLRGTDLRGSVKATFENRKESIQSRISKLEESGVGKGHLKNIDEFISGNKTFNEVLDDYAIAYAEKVNSNVPWKWRNIPGGDGLSQKQLKLIRERAKELGKIPDVPMKPGTKYPDFEKADLIIKIDGEPVIIQLPKEYWKKSDPDQFGWLDSQLPGGKRPPGTTWHHSEVDGRMELVPFGIHNSVYHSGGRAPGGWAHGKR
ncbi:A nuclease of the HNH/ENDO VII superfamily with conserved WHH [Bacillus sp. 491mf]|uniref:HNH endonuclease signature motif containing protein n=1 Tax=Bacillus sp. 491mf TaxID=1761755 RepID=UPI0008E73A8F|nr:HNH endonuclease [Bacillus sp. 491mf]SFD60220.1 A nuclease of the HNH/ENDO VII superfamily with conserved WHH [Bacillus sp. 491mf]